MVRRNVGTPLLLRYILLGLLVLVAVRLGGSLARQTQVRQHRQDELRLLGAQIALAQEQTADLKKHLEFVQSPAAVEAWARENGWARPDEVPVVLVGPEAEAVVPGEKTRGVGLAPASAREAWWDLFFGDR